MSENYRSRESDDKLKEKQPASKTQKPKGKTSFSASF